MDGIKCGIILLLHTVLTLLIYCSEKNCSDYFNGKWKYDHHDVDYIYVERNHKKQFEYMENGKYYYEFDIEWLTDCTYELTYKGTTSPVPAAAQIGEKLIVEITTINDSITEYKTTFRNMALVGSMSRIK